MREAYEKEIAEASDQKTRTFEARIKDLSNKLDAERAKGGGTAQELRELESRVTTLTVRNKELETAKQQIDRRIEELSRELEDAAKGYRADLARKVTHSPFLYPTC
jgi:predicted  nucleic acid-binding Zn-ribbon protein